MGFHCFFRAFLAQESVKNRAGILLGALQALVSKRNN